MRPALIVCVAGLAGCSSFGPLTANEHDDVVEGRRAVLLLQLCVEENGVPEPFLDCGLTAGLGNFATGGWIEDVELRAVDERAAAEGRFYLLVEPGLHYLAFRDAGATHHHRSLEYDGLVRWTVEVPRDAAVCDAGRLTLAIERHPLMFGYREVVSESGNAVTPPALPPLGDEPRGFAHLEPLRLAELERHRGTRVLRRALPERTARGL